MEPKRLTQELITRWHGLDSVDEIAAILDIHRNIVLGTWRQMKANGTLPKGDRPRSRQSFLNRGENLADGRPSVIFEDPLLDALKAGKR